MIELSNLIDFKLEHALYKKLKIRKAQSMQDLSWLVDKMTIETGTGI